MVVFLMDDEVERMWKEAVAPFIVKDCGKPREFCVRAEILTEHHSNDSKKVSKVKLSP
jgi:hypothetical protein